MTWTDPVWAQWSETVRSVESAAQTASDNREVAIKWTAYAARLEAELDEVWSLRREGYRDGDGQSKHKATKRSPKF